MAFFPPLLGGNIDRFLLAVPVSFSLASTTVGACGRRRKWVAGRVWRSDMNGLLAVPTGSGVPLEPEVSGCMRDESHIIERDAACGRKEGTGGAEAAEGRPAPSTPPANRLKVRGNGEGRP